MIILQYLFDVGGVLCAFIYDSGFPSGTFLGTIVLQNLLTVYDYDNFELALCQLIVDKEDDVLSRNEEDALWKLDVLMRRLWMDLFIGALLHSHGQFRILARVQDHS